QKRRPATRMPNGIDHHVDSLEPDLSEEVQKHFDNFGFYCGIVAAGDDFRTGLDMLAITSLLRTLAAKHRRDVVELHHARFVLQLVLDVRTDDGSRPLRSKAERSTIAVHESVHLFRYDVGLLTDAAHKKFCRLQNRRADFVEAVTLKHLTDTCFYG